MFNLSNVLTKTNSNMSQFRCATVGNLKCDNQSIITKVTDVVCGHQFVIYHISNNVFYFRGLNSYGECAITDCNDPWILAPRKIDFFEKNNIRNISKVCSGSYGRSVYWICSDGSVYGSGCNDYKQLGLGNNEKTIRTPTLIPFFKENNITVIDAACNNNSGFILDDKGRVYSCGYNGQGQLGHGDTTNITNWKMIDAVKNMKVIQIATAYRNCFMLQDDGSLYSVGYNGHGQLGLGNTTDTTTVTKIPFFNNIKIIQIACGVYHCVALDDQGRIYTWGYNGHCECGDTTTTDLTTPKSIISFYNKFVEIDASYYNSSATTQNGEIFIWGYNEYYNCLNGNKTNVNIPTKINMDFVSQSVGVNNVSKIRLGYYESHILFEEKDEKEEFSELEIKLQKENKQLTDANKVLQQKVESLETELLKERSGTIFKLKSVDTDVKNDDEKKEADGHVAIKDDVLLEFENRIKEWNIETEKLKLMIDDQDEKKQNDAQNIVNAEQLLNEHLECSKIINIQSERVQWSSSSMIKLVGKNSILHNELTKYEKQWNSEMENTTKICKEYDDIKAEREKSQKLIENEIKRCNELIAKENELFQSKYNIEFISNETNEKKKQYESLFNTCIELIGKYNEFIETNQSNIDFAQQKLNNKWDQFEKNWKKKDHWKVDDVIAWFKYKTSENNVTDTDFGIFDKIKEEMKKQNITNCLDFINGCDQQSLFLLGITDYGMRMFLTKAIQTLRTKYPLTEQANDVNAKTDHIPSRFICPLTNKIMNDPVRAYDNNTYERSAIEPYLKEHGKTPKSNKRATFTMVIPNLQLKQEITAFKNM
eukprot:408077_1